MLLVACSLAACASKPLRFRGEALSSLQQVKREGAETLRPAEFRSMQEACRQGDALLKEKEQGQAESYFQLALLKGELLQQEVKEQKARRQEAERLALVRKKAAEERRVREEANRLAQVRAEALAQKETREAARRRVRPSREHPLLYSYTVARGESLPLIASKPEVYGDRNLWPLIYRANRDQISDPRHIWPGQVLRIPRNVGRDDISEARRYAQERPLH